MSDPHCKDCRGTGVIRRKVMPRIWCGALITEWCTPCGCGRIDEQDFGSALSRMAKGT